VNLRERRLAQIVRDFIDAYVLAGDVADGLRGGALEFISVEALVGDAEDSVLYRLKEGCHALFRSDQDRPPDELAAEELFDLAVGALFHEAMKFREGFYVTRSYAPRLERMRAAEGKSSALLEAFRGVLESGRRRVDESAVELQSLLRETREQLLTVLRQIGGCGAVARALVESPVRCERVFGVPLTALLCDIYGDAGSAYERAVGDLLENGHFEEAGALLDRPEVRVLPVFRTARPYAAGMASYYRGKFADAVAQLETCDLDSPPRAHSAFRVLSALASDVGGAEPELAERARAAAARLLPHQTVESSRAPRRAK
jgi:hypothetical protein